MAPASDGPTLGEVVRRLEEITAQLARLAQQLTDMPTHLDSTYVRKETYMVKESAQDKAIRDLEDSRRNISRLAWTSIALPIILLVILTQSGLK